MDYLDNYYYKLNNNDENDTQRAARKAIGAILPALFENELTKKQEMCLKYKYIYGKTQSEIAKLLKVSQPTVSRHIARGKSIVNDKLKYCSAAILCALNEYDK